MENPVDELKRELAQLGGKTAPPVDHITEEQADIGSMKAIFDNLLSNERHATYLEAKNRVSKCCSRCYFIQPMANEHCALCGSIPKGWLPAEEEPLAGAGIDTYDERRMFKRMSANYSIADLRTALRSGWARTPEREEFATLLLGIREAQQIHREPVEVKPEPVSQRETDDGIRDAKKYYQLQQERLDEELAALRS